MHLAGTASYRLCGTPHGANRARILKKKLFFGARGKINFRTVISGVLRPYYIYCSFITQRTFERIAMILRSRRFENTSRRPHLLTYNLDCRRTRNGLLSDLRGLCGTRRFENTSRRPPYKFKNFEY